MSDDGKVIPQDAIVESANQAVLKKTLQRELDQAVIAINKLSAETNPLQHAELEMRMAHALLGLERNAEAWNEARSALDVFIQYEKWSAAVEACELLYQTDQPASIKALGHGVWLAVTYPIDPEYSIVMLNFIVEETPANSDGAAVAVATAHYIVDLRASDENHASLSFLTTNMISRVAQRHSDIKSQEALDFWMEKLELKDPRVFLPRMGAVIEAIVGEGEWWFDRDVLRAKLPVQ
jgi:hypothetical protein